MTPVLTVAIASAVFVGSHFLLSHPLRAPLVRRLGAGGFAGVYALVALASFAWLAIVWTAAPPGPLLWPVGEALWGVVTLVMLLASVLLMGSFIRNPALPAPGAEQTVQRPPQGVLSITRHPMMWAFALWAACHMAVFPTPANLVLTTAILILSLVGAALQDRKKAALAPQLWPAWEAKTSYLPFAAITQGRARLAGFKGHDLGGGLVLWLAATWAHLPLAHVAAGVWRWVER